MNQSNTAYASTSVQADEGLRSHMVQVYREMGVALGISGIVSYICGHDIKAIAAGGSTFLPQGLINGVFNTPLIWLAILAPLGMVLFMGSIMRNASAAGARKFLWSFSAVFGLSLSMIFVKYTDAMIAQAFLATAGAFAGLSLWGYTTKKDISGWGSFLMMGLIGLIIASIVNIFMGSGPLQLAISAIGVLIFAGFTAYDTQEIKTNYLSMRETTDEEYLAKMGTMGALNLFLDFVLLFQHLLSLLNILDD